jgi:hypothetical protein
MIPTTSYRELPCSASDLTPGADRTPTKSPNRLKQFLLHRLRQFALSKCNRILGSHTAKVIAGLLIGIGIGLSIFGGAGVPLILAGAGLWTASTVSMAATLKVEGSESVGKDVAISIGMTVIGVGGGLAAATGILPMAIGITFGTAALTAGVLADIEGAQAS